MDVMLIEEPWYEQEHRPRVRLNVTYATAAAYAVAARAETIERHTRAILDIICGTAAKVGTDPGAESGGVQ